MDLSGNIYNILSFFKTEINFNGWLLALIIILIVLSAFFSATETAYSSANLVRLKLYASEGKHGAKTAVKLSERFDKTLSTLLVGNNIVNIGTATLAVRFFSGFIQNKNLADLLSTVVITLLVLVFGEITPKSIAKAHADGFAMFMSPIVNFFAIILTPLTLVFIGLQKLLQRHKNDEPSVTEGELEAILDTMGEEGVIENGEIDLMHSVLDLDDKAVSDIMVPRIDMVAINVDEDIEQIKKTFFNYQFSRIPVYQNDKDNIIGILYERDLFTKLIKKQRINIKSLVKPALYVSKSMKVNSLIQELQAAKVHIAIVSGEYGETAGLVTMEDALEELVGEIYDEHDDNSVELIKKIADDEYDVDASIEIGDLFEYLELGKIPMEDKYVKLASWLYEQCEEIPEIGFVTTYKTDYVKRDEENEYIDYSKVLHFTVTAVEDRRITRVDLKITDFNPEEDSI